MAQRCLLHQAALAEGSGSYSRADVQRRLPAGSQGDERDEQIALGIKKKKIIAEICLMCYSLHMQVPFLSEETHLVIAAEQSNAKPAKHRRLQRERDR